MKKLIILLIVSLVNILPQSNIFAADGGETTILINGTEIDNTAPQSASAVNSSNVGAMGQEFPPAGNQNANEFVGPPAPTPSSSNILGINDADLRNGSVDMNTIPAVIVSVINVLLGVAGTISIVALIYYAVQMQINSGITGDSSGVENAKKGMRGALFGFVLAILAWFIVIRFIEILTTVSA